MKKIVFLIKACPILQKQRLLKRKMIRNKEQPKPDSGKIPMITEDDFMELYTNFRKLLINYKLGVAYKERISYQDKSGWELMFDYISKSSKLYKYIK